MILAFSTVFNPFKMASCTFPFGHKTKTASYKYVRQRLREIYDKNLRRSVRVKLIRGTEGYSFLYKLILCHPSQQQSSTSPPKLGKGNLLPASFIIQPNPITRNNGLHTEVKRHDGSVVSFSWRDCSMRSPENTQKQNLKCAMRVAIENQVRQFRANRENLRAGKPLICELCDVSSPSTFYHVDHDNPSFKELVDEVFEVYSEGEISRLKFGQNETTKQIIFDDTCTFTVAFKEVWEDHHRENANLQILCRSCNLRKPRK